MTATGATSTLPAADLEAIYERLAIAIDAAGEDRAAVYLAKVVLLLAERLGDRAAVFAAIEAGLADL